MQDIMDLYERSIELQQSIVADASECQALALDDFAQIGGGHAVVWAV